MSIIGEVNLFTGVILFVAGFSGAIIGSIGGSGGLVAVPVLLSLGVPPVTALSTNKYQSTVAKLGMVYSLAKSGWLKKFPTYFIITSTIAAAVYSALGAFLVLHTSQKINIEWVLVFLQLVIIFYLARIWFFVKKKKKDKVKKIEHLEGKKYIVYRVVSGLICLYDGFFGPGTGNFLFLLFEKIGFSTKKSLVLKHIFNFSSNLGGALVFLIYAQGSLLFTMLMIAGSFLGGYFGTMVITRIKMKKVRKIIIVVTSVMLLIQVTALLLK